MAWCPRSWPWRDHSAASDHIRRAALSRTRSGGSQYPGDYQGGRRNAVTQPVTRRPRAALAGRAAVGTSWRRMSFPAPSGREKRVASADRAFLSRQVARCYPRRNTPSRRARIAGPTPSTSLLARIREIRASEARVSSPSILIGARRSSPLKPSEQARRCERATQRTHRGPLSRTTSFRVPRRAENRARMVDGTTVAGRPANERVLHDVLGLRERTEHAVRDADQKPTKRLEIVGHWSWARPSMPNRRDRRGRCDMASPPAKRATKTAVSTPRRVTII
jgi:hypothetical protein